MVGKCALLAALGICLAAAPAVSKQPAVARVKQAAAKAAPVKRVDLPGPVDANSLGFGSARGEVERLMGKPTRTAKVTGGVVWFYDLSSISLADGKVVAWCTYRRPLPMNIGTARPGSPSPRTGSSAQDLVAAQGTPDTVVTSGDCQIWFYGLKSYSLRKGKVVPTKVRAPMTEAVKPDPRKVAPAKPASPKGGPYRQHLQELLGPAMSRG